ncbi:MAG: hypothetical protein GWP14_04460 [Actinobacteria bacterium]|nr:hypothetical protein [Actinomycetota bacterium]
MDLRIKQNFIDLWGRYFDGADLPLAVYYTDDSASAQPVSAPAGHKCFICQLSRARNGESLCFEADSVGCGGGKKYLGFTQQLMPDFEHFLSCGLPGKLEGERYKKSPQLVKDMLSRAPQFTAPARFIVVKRWDILDESDSPEVVVFFAQPDILSGLFTLANFDHPDPDGVFAPFSAGCGSIIQYAYLEKHSDNPRAVLGMFDISARLCVSAYVLTFAVCMNKFLTMVDNIRESFLTTAPWSKVRRRIARTWDKQDG